MSNQQNRVLTVTIIAVVAIAALVGAWYFFMFKPAQEEKARLEQVARQKAEQQRKRAAQKKAKYDELIINADSAYGQEDWEGAKSLFTEASALYPKEAYPQDQLALVNEKLDELAALEARKLAGVVDEIDAPTGRFYVIISSSVDGDLAMDYASQLAKEGNAVQIIKPSDNNRVYHRVALGDYDSYDQAKAAAASITSFDEAWVLEY